jgi:ferric-dicitrate binding protein FerR (iron transport regulator)
MTPVSSYARIVSTVTVALLCAGVQMQAQIAGPDLNGAARLMSFTGQISYMRGSDLWALNIGDTVQPQQVIVTGPDGYGVFQVSDGSTFEVFPKSKVIFRQNRGDWKDLLEVWLGKVRVQIEHPGGLPNNNKVRTPSAVISVRGTIFDVEVEDEDGTTLVLDEEGQVEVRHILRAGDPVVLNPNQYIRVYKNEPIAKRLVDKGGLLQRAARALSDVLYQEALNAERGGGGGLGRTVATAPGSPADTKNGNPAPPPPPAPPPAPPPPPPPPTGH